MLARPRVALVVFACITTAIATRASASEIHSAPVPPEPIYGGMATEECGWPTTVFLDGCTGTLVHPELVVFASHCLFFAGGVEPQWAVFGEDSEAPAREVPIADCTMYPGWDPEDEGSFGNDVAFCQLAEPVLDVPIVPILMGCETDVLGPGQEVTLVGFGVTDAGTFGVKNEVVTEINGFEGPEINLGGNGTSSCNGDSGGPAFLQLADGSWRVFGVTSRGVSGDCADESIYGMMHPHVQWMEDTTGLDISPCHDADGTWNPGDGCTDFPLEPGIAASGWEAGCGEGRVGGPSATCGDPFGGEEETGSTGEADTGLDSSGGDSGETGLPGGTAADGDGTQGSGTGGGTDTEGSPSEDDDIVVTCTCRNGAPTPAPLWLLPALAFVRRRRAPPRNALSR